MNFDKVNRAEEQIHINKCLLLIEQKMGWGSADNWHSKVFDELSDAIQKETSVLLSSTTLKRVWGKISYESTPSISTLNTLSQFAGFLNWRDFKSKQEVYSEGKRNKSRINQTKVFGYAAILAIFFISLFSVIGKSEKKTKDFDYSKVKFESRPIVLGLPNSVVFDLDLNNLESDSIYIQQFWDKTKTIKLKPKQSQATGQYYYPGYFRAKLLVDGDIKKEHGLFIKSNGWLGTLDYKPIPKYVQKSEILTETMSFSNSILNEIQNSKEPLMSSFHFIDDLGDVSGDNFELRTSLKNVYSDKWAVCQKTIIVIVGTKSALIIPFSIPGCTSEIGIMLSEKYLSGKEYDLSSLGVYFSDLRDVIIKVENKKLKVFVDDVNIYSNSFNESIGNVVGVRYRFVGAGEISKVALSNAESNDFVLDL